MRTPEKGFYKVYENGKGDMYIKSDKILKKFPKSDNFLKNLLNYGI